MTEVPLLGGDVYAEELDGRQMGESPLGRGLRLEVPFYRRVSDQVRARLGDGVISLEERGVRFAGRSGHGQLGLNVDLREVDVEGSNLRGVLAVDSVRNMPTGFEDRLLGRLVDLSYETRVAMGELILCDPQKSLSKGQIMDARGRGMLWLPNGNSGRETTISDDGVVEINLDDLHYYFCEANFTENDEINSPLLHGKHGLRHVVSPMPRTTLPNELQPKEFFIGSIRIALGPYMAVIEPETNDPEVLTLASSLLHGSRTTGITTPRQIALFVNKAQAVDPKKLKVRMRIYPMEFPHDIKLVMTPEQVRDGVGFEDLAMIEAQPERLLRMMDLVSPAMDKDSSYGLILDRGAAGDIPWVKTPQAQFAHAQKCVQGVVLRKPDRFLRGRAIPQAARYLTRRLNFTGGEHANGSVLVTDAFPAPHEMHTLMNEGVGVFVARRLQMPERAFDDENPPTEEDLSGYQLYLRDIQAKAFMEAERNGAGIFVALPTVIEDDDKNDPDSEKARGRIIEAHVRKWHKGMWVRPEAIERVDKMDTCFAFYCSHKGEVMPTLRAQIPAFMERMKNRFGDHMGVTHGKGPGGMKVVDEIAEELGIVRTCIGIGFEKIEQTPNFRPEAMSDYHGDERLARQQRMDDLATFKIFNIGGAGTIEEAAITICSQKTLKNPITPIIFVDPEGLGQDGGNLFQHLMDQIALMAEEHKIGEAEAAQGRANIRLLQVYAPRFCHLVSNYNEAADIIEQFANDPMQYYRNAGIPERDVKIAWDSAKDTFARTGFNAPQWLHEKMVAAGIEGSDE